YRSGQLVDERLLQGLVEVGELARQVGQVENGALEEPAARRLIARRLVERDDVGAVLTEHPRDTRHDSGPVLALHDQAPVVRTVVLPRHRLSFSDTEASSFRRHCSVFWISLKVKMCSPRMLLRTLGTAEPSRRASLVGL